MTRNAPRKGFERLRIRVPTAKEWRCRQLVLYRHRQVQMLRGSRVGRQSNGKKSKSLWEEKIKTFASYAMVCLPTPILSCKVYDFASIILHLAPISGISLKNGMVCPC
jgi:hypothetical protein